MNSLILQPWLMLIKERALYSTLLRREISARYRATVMGWIWPILHPLFLLGIYSFVFGTVFGSRWGVAQKIDNQWHFSLMLFSGLICFNLLADCLSRAPLLIANHTNYVKRVVFPLEVLSVVQVGASLFNAALSFSVLALFMLIAGEGYPINIFAVLFIIIPFIMFLIGLSWFLSALGVYLRDLEQIMPTVVTAMMFLSPVFFAIEVLPVAFRKILLLNPLTHVIETVRGLLFSGLLPNALQWLSLFGMGLMMMYFGFWFFRRASKGFADVL